jgi:uncharacterized damage-inducible protein DinB
MPIAESLLPEFDHEMAKTRRTLERVPAASFGFKPHETSRCLGDLAVHLTMIPRWLAMLMDADETDFAQSPPPPYEEPANAAAVLEKFDSALAAGRASLARASDEHMLNTWTGRIGDRVLFTVPRLALVRGFILGHMIHHRGQLTVYYRMLGVPVPALFGASADESTA